jgi:hypothetical protein
MLNIEFGESLGMSMAGPRAALAAAIYPPHPGAVARMVASVVNVGGYSRVPARAGDPNLMSDRQRESLHTASHMFLLKLLTGDTSSATLPPPSPGVTTEATLQSDGDAEPSDAVNGILDAAPHAARILTARSAALDDGIDQADLDQAVNLLSDKWDKVLAAAESLRLNGKVAITDDDDPDNEDAGIVARPAVGDDDPDDEGSDASIAKSVKTAAASARNGWQPGEMVGD